MLVVMRREGGWSVLRDGEPVEEGEIRPFYETKDQAVEDAMRIAIETGEKVDIIPSIYD